MYTTNARIGASHTDKNGNMKLTSAVDIMQDCSQFWLESEPDFKNFLENKNLALFLVFRQIDIIRMPVYAERLIIQTHIFGCKDFYGYRNTAILDAHMQPCLLSWSIGTFVNLETGKMTRVPSDVTDRITVEDKIEMEYTSKKISVPLETMERLPTVAVRRNDIDRNHHMNNARYIEAALECLSDEFSIRRLRVEYKIPAKYRDVLYPARIKTDAGKQYILLLNEQDKPYTIMEFSEA